MLKKASRRASGANDSAGVAAWRRGMQANLVSTLVTSFSLGPLMALAAAAGRLNMVSMALKVAGWLGKTSIFLDNERWLRHSGI
jgi:hypothetical protein